jgi:hypothetical protein
LSQNRDQEEREMQEAIALSIGQPPPGQENGVTGIGQQFGPARGEYPDTKRWAMTVSNAAAREIVDDPPPADRRRKPGEPAFLRVSDGFGSQSLPTLLTIYHSIPLAREALLLPNYQQFNYGYDAQWWKGHRIEAPKIVSLDEHGAHHNRDDVLIETQRLMAFLDNTNRAYASIDALAGLQNYRKKEAESELSRFLEAWSEGAMIRIRDDPTTQVFSSRGIRHDSGTIMDKFFFCLEPAVIPEIDQTFTNILDKLIWADQFSDNPLNDVWIDKIGDIVTLRLSDPLKKQGRLGVEIPAIWYPDRYMEHFREASHDMRVRRKNILEDLWRLERSEKEILSFTPAGRQTTLDIKKVLLDAAERAPLILKNQPQPGSGTTSYRPPPGAGVSNCVKALQNLVTSIEVKVAEYEMERRELRAEVGATTAEFTRPDVESPLSPSHRYTLRGVSTKQSITYVLRPIAGDRPELEFKGSDTGEWQWWRISLSGEETEREIPASGGANPQTLSSPGQGPLVDASGPFSPWPASGARNEQSSSRQNANVITYDIRKVSEEDVLVAAREEGDTITLVYASDRAVEFQGSPLSGPLQMFVKADNKMFENELRGIDQSQQIDSVTNGEEMAQLHFSPAHGMQDVPLNEDLDETREGWGKSFLSPTMALCPRREADGQPSPKRAKGKDDPPPYHEHNRNAPEMQERGGAMGILGTVRPDRSGQYPEKTMGNISDGAESDEKGAASLENSPIG